MAEEEFVVAVVGMVEVAIMANLPIIPTTTSIDLEVLIIVATSEVI